MVIAVSGSHIDATILCWEDQCIAVHTAVQRKKARLVGGPISAPPCPQCKARIVAQSVNITLQNIITERLAIEETMRRAEMESVYPTTPVRGQLLYEELVTPRNADFVRSTSTLPWLLLESFHMFISVYIWQRATRIYSHW